MNYNDMHPARAQNVCGHLTQVHIETVQLLKNGIHEESVLHGCGQATM